MENVQGQHQNAGPPQKRRRRHRQNTLLPQRPKKPATGYTMFLRNYFSTHPTQEGVSVSLYFNCTCFHIFLKY